MPKPLDAEATAKEVERVKRLTHRLRRMWRSMEHPILTFAIAHCVDDLAAAVVNTEKREVERAEVERR